MINDPEYENIDDGTMKYDEEMAYEEYMIYLSEEMAYEKYVNHMLKLEGNL